MMMEDCFQVGVKALISNHEGKILLLQRGNENWDIPGGRIHKNETLEAGLKREVREETGLDKIFHIDFFKLVLSPTRILIPSGNVGLVLAVYLCHFENVSCIRLSDEHIGYGWFEPKEIAERLSSYFPEELMTAIADLQQTDSLL